jgi:RNA polymerase sporulation-specific sigma factor
METKELTNNTVLTVVKGNKEAHCGNTEITQSKEKMEKELIYDQHDQYNRELIILARNGDEKAANELFAKNDGLNKHMAKRYLYSGIEYEELLGISRYGMFVAYQTFDLKRNVTFAIYAEHCICNQIRLSFRTKKSKAYLYNTLHLEDEISDSNGNVVRRMDTLTDDTKLFDPCDIQIKQEEINRLRQIVRNLDDKEKVIIMERYYRNKTQQEVAKQLNMYQVQVSRLEKKILQNIRAAF